MASARSIQHAIILDIISKIQANMQGQKALLLWSFH